MAVPPIGRLHRDNAARHGVDPPPHAPAPDSPEAVLASGHYALRFPATLEAAFAADTMAQRRLLLTVCAVLGCPGVLLGAATLDQMVPEVSALVWFWVKIWMALTVGGLALVWYTPTRWRSHWHGEVLTTVMATAMGLLITWIPTATKVDTAFTHSAMAALPVMYICIAARQRFYWALGSTVVAFLAYALFVQGHTQQQTLIAESNLRLMALSFAFTLAANYAFEHRERRNWLLRRQAQRQRQALVDASHTLQTLSTQDPLTGLPNRRHFHTELSNAWHQAATGGKSLAVLIMDVDFFKRYNDTRGHPAGDACLIQIARILAGMADAHGGIVGRLGGEEFGLVLPGYTLDEARVVADSVCRSVSDARIPHGASAVSPFVSMSVGVAQGMPATSLSAHDVLERADRALYQAKRQGRNRFSADAADTTGSMDSTDAAQAPASYPALHTLSGASAATADGPLQEAALSATLNSHFRWLRFPAGQEKIYRHHDEAARRRHIALMSVLGLVLYNLYVQASRPMFPDLSDELLSVQLWLNLVMLALTGVASFIRMPLARREAMASLGASIIGVASAWVLSHSKETSTLSYAASLALIPMFAGVVLRQPFWFTCVPALGTCVAAGWLLTARDEIQSLTYYDSMLIIVLITAFTLILAYTLEHGARKEWLLSQIDLRQRETLEATAVRLQQLSVVDPLTGISNRRQLEEDLDRIWAECLKDQRPLAMLIVDIDHFKQYNDGYGHLQGDRCLTRIANIIHQTARADKGLAARLGGEEFGILLPGASVAEAALLGERVCRAVREAAIEHLYAGGRHVTVSIGVASVRPATDTTHVALFASADEALYAAKREGRDRVATPSP